MKFAVLPLLLAGLVVPAAAATTIRIMPPDGGVLAAGQRFDLRVEAASDSGGAAGLRVWLNDRELTSGPGGDVFLARNMSLDAAGPVVIRARTADGTTAEARLVVEAWAQGRPGARRAKNVILLLGDGMGAAHRTAARIVSRGLHNGKAAGRLAMDTLEVTGLVMTASLNGMITDSSPGMAAYSTGQKNNNNQSGVFPDNTRDPFDNPRIEYLGELLRRTRGPGFNVGIVTTADVTDSTPAANAVHTADRFAGAAIAAQFFDERATNGVTVLLGGGSRHYRPKAAGGARPDARNLVEEYTAAGYAFVQSGSDLWAQMARPEPPAALLGLFHPSHLPVAFDKVGAGRYSDELAQPRNAAYRDTPMLEDLARLALRTLDAHSPQGFYLMIEGASVDKRAHAADAERTIWDTIEFDRAVQVALDYAARTNGDADPDNDTLVIVAADHECGGFAVVGVGNERYAPSVLGRAVRDYAAVFRFEADQRLNLFPNYVVDERGFPVDPDPSRKILVGWAAAPDRKENWLSDRLQHEAAIREPREPGLRVAVANPARDAGEAIQGFLVPGVIENGATPCPAADGCPGDTQADGHSFAGHTATDVPISATGPGAWQFTGVFENTDVFLKILRSAAGSH
ncbi:MAG: alkaline phosphatase [Acidobacteriota bacterium]